MSLSSAFQTESRFRYSLDAFGVNAFVRFELGATGTSWHCAGPRRLLSRRFRAHVSRWFDFRSDAEDFRQHLATLSASGGGDFPEAPERGFQAAEQLAWRTADTTAKLAFWVADAPHHDGHAQAMADALRGMQALGVHVYPVASSGVDDLTELSMRTAAALTGGRYLFLTDDSGVGNDHKEPTIPCYFVTSLRDAIVRMVDIELAGRYHEPDSSEIIRKGGDPRDGACQLGSGESVFVY